MGFLTAFPLGRQPIRELAVRQIGKDDKDCANKKRGGNVAWEEIEPRNNRNPGKGMVFHIIDLVLSLSLS